MCCQGDQKLARIFWILSWILYFLSACLPECLSACLPACLPACLSVRPSVRLSVCLSVCLSAYPFVCLSVCLSVCQSIYLSVCMCPRRPNMKNCRRMQGANEKLEKALMAAHFHAPPMHASAPAESAGQGLPACCESASDHWSWLQQHNTCQSQSMQKAGKQVRLCTWPVLYLRCL